MTGAISGVKMQGLWRDYMELRDESWLHGGGGTERAQAASGHR